MTTLSSLRNQDWKKTVKLEPESVNKSSKNITTNNITEQNGLIYTGVKLVGDKIYIPQRNLNKNTKRGWEIWLEGQIKKKT